MSKLSKETKNFLERELRQYKENKRLLERLKKEDPVVLFLFVRTD